MASLVKWLHYSGAIDSDGEPVATGSAYFYERGSTSVGIDIFADPEETTPLTQPVTLNAAGQAEVYVATDCEVIVKDAEGGQVTLSTSAESISAGQVTTTWSSSEETLDLTISRIETFMAIEASDVPSESYVVLTVPTASPSFEFDPTKKLNVYKATYSSAMGTLYVTWPSPAPTLVSNTTYRIKIQIGTGTGTTVDFPPYFTHSWGQSGSPTTLDSNTYYVADFIVGATPSLGLYQITPWWTYGGAPW